MIGSNKRLLKMELFFDLDARVDVIEKSQLERLVVEDSMRMKANLPVTGAAGAGDFMEWAIAT